MRLVEGMMLINWVFFFNVMMVLVGVFGVVDFGNMIWDCGIMKEDCLFS